MLTTQGYVFASGQTEASIQGLPKRFYDLLMWDPDGKLVGIEVKSSRIGRLVLNNQQVAFDALTFKTGSTIMRGPQTGAFLQNVMYVGVDVAGVNSAVWGNKVLSETLLRLGVEVRTVRHVGTVK